MSIWNALIDKILDKCSPNLNGVMVPGSNAGSDLSASIALVKNRLECFLLEIQKQDPRLLDQGGENQINGSQKISSRTLNQ